MRHLFGTDGIRGEAGKYPLDRATVEKIGLALVWTLREEEKIDAPRVLVGRDTRESGQELEEAMARGIARGGAEVVTSGVVTTPAVACMTHQAGFDAGVMISASHNSYEDNGLKVFSRSGYKLPDAEELSIERRILAEDFDPPTRPAPPSAQAGDLLERYYLLLASRVGSNRPFLGIRVALDCAHGAAYQIAPEIFRRLGTEPLVMGNTPDGRNINRDCGSMHPEQLAEYVQRENADLGFAFDGDGDRVVTVDRTGRVLDGDHILYLAAQDLKERGALPGQAVVATVMSNLWLEKALGAIGIRLVRAPVGDRYVLEEMRKGGSTLGGEQSGHVIFLDDATTGDGILTALKLLDLIRRRRTDLAAWAQGIVRYPQVLLNVKVRCKTPLADVPEILEATKRAESQLNGRGRVLLRYSGTEPRLRVMVEGEDESEVRRLAEDLRQLVGKHLGDTKTSPL